MELYRELWRPRPPAVTLLEFMPVLRELFPARRYELELILGAYLKVRRGEVPETQFEAAAINRPGAISPGRRRG